MSFRGVLIGCGFFAQNHLHAWAEQKDAEIVAVCDADADKAKAMQARFGIARSYADARDMLEREQPDFVDIVTTSASHRTLVEMSVAPGRLVICQKPFADTYADGLAMVEAARNAGAHLAVHENFRWQLPYVKLAEEVSSGKIGDVRFARISFRHGFNNYVNQPYLAEVERFALMDMGLHLYDLARHLVGEIEDIACRIQTRNKIVRGEDAFTTLLGCANGAHVVVDASYDTRLDPEPFPQTTAIIEGDTGTIEIGTGYRYVRHQNGSHDILNVEPPTPAWGAKPWHAIQQSVAAFNAHAVDVMKGRTTPQPSGEHNLRTLAASLASYDSAATGSTIRLDDWINGQKIS